MSIKHILLGISIILFLISCNKNVIIENYNFHIDTIKINNGSSNHFINNEMIEINKLIVLETTEESLIGEITKLKTENNRIFVLDKEITKALIVFDNNGKYLFKIDSKGNGPGEFYRTPIDFSIDNYNKEIYVFEAESQKIVIFNWNGKYIREIKLKKWPYAFTLIDPKTFAFSYKQKSFENEFVISYENEKNKIFGFNKLKNNLTYTSPFPITKNENNIYFTPHLSSLICKIDSCKITHGYFIDFGNKNLPLEIKNKLERKFDYELIKDKNYAYGICNVFESDNLFSFTYTYKMIKHLYIIDKNNNYHKNCICLFDNIIPTNIQEIKGDTLIIPITSTEYDIYNTSKKQNSSEASTFLSKTPNKLITLLDTIPESANPIICALRIKSYH